ncbi:MAG: hypothetical protein ACPG5U_05445 [Planktomarina sp.]
MRNIGQKYKSIVGAIFALCLVPPVFAQTSGMDALFDRLQTVAPEDAPSIVAKIELEWSKSGSPAMDLLLRRGRKALEADQVDEAINHFTALTDHAPEFAEGWHALAIAYFDKEQFGVAMGAIERTLALEPRHFGAMEGLMVLLDDAGHTDQALRVVSLIEAIHPHHPQLSSYKERLEAKSSGRKL